MQNYTPKDLALRSVLFILIAIAVAGTFFPLLSWEAWYIRMFDFPRLQIFFISLAATILFFLIYYRQRKRGRFLIFLLFFILIYQSTRIFPYTRFAQEEVLYANRQGEEQNQFSILVSNVYMDNKDCQQLLSEIENQNPDVILTLETDSHWQQGLARLKKDYPYTMEVPLPNTYGLLLYSRLPLKNDSVRYLVEDDIPSIKTLLQLPSGQWIQLFGVHPRPPAPGESDDTKERDAEIILIGKEAKKSDYPVIVAGDFNDVAWSATTNLFRETSRLMDPRIGRGFYNTFHAEYPVFRWPLDHIFHSSDFELVEIKRLPYIGSDHFPIYISLQLTPEGPLEQKEPVPDEDTEEEANKAIREGLEDSRQH